MTTARRFLITALALAMTLPARAYNDSVTHPKMTIFATEKSVLYQDGSIMFSLGLLPANKQRFRYRLRFVDTVSSSTPTTYSLSEFVAEGAFDEDIFPRSLNHFYDPITDRPLTIVFPLGERSWRWSLEDSGQISGQSFSLNDARTFLNTALTFNQGTPVEADSARRTAMAQMFVSLGHAVHHIQDMAQPQHVRNDPHLDMISLGGLNPLYNPSRYERYTADVAIDSFAATANPVFPGSADFKTSRDFWFNPANSGLAQFTNNSFVSQGTNFTFRNGQANTGRYILPQPGAPSDAMLSDLFGPTIPPEIQTLCGITGVDCTVTMYSTVVSQKASTLSIFDQDLRAKGVFVTYTDGDLVPTYQSERLFDLNRFNFADAHKVLIGKAVSYSAGLISHFFRGKLDVTAPSSGPYAVVDHSTNQGFTKVTVTVKNVTPGEALSGGTLQAIAKFHRNNCYKPDLSGEFTVDDTGKLIAPCPNYRSDEAHLRLTAEEPASFGVGESKEMTFTFSDPIPLDATDLILQVYYRGTVGTEQNAFALGAVDLSEPTFVTVMNATDVFELSGTAFYYWQDIIANVAQSPYSVVDIDRNGQYNSPPDVDVRGGDIAYEIKVNGKTVGTVPLLPQGRFARIATLVSPFGFELVLRATGNGFNSVDFYAFPAKTQQFDPDRNSYIVSAVDLLRNQTLQWDSVSYFHFYPTTGTPLDFMPISKVTDATVLIPVQMAP